MFSSMLVEFLMGRRLRATRKRSLGLHETGPKVRTQMKLKRKARVNRSDTRTIRHALEQLSAKASVRKKGDEFVVEAEMEGSSTRE